MPPFYYIILRYIHCLEIHFKEFGINSFFNGIFQRLDDVILSKDVIECQRTIFSGKDLVTHGSGRLKDAALFEKKIECNCFKMLIRLRF